MSQQIRVAYQTDVDSKNVKRRQDLRSRVTNTLRTPFYILSEVIFN